MRRLKVVAVGVLVVFLGVTGAWAQTVSSTTGAINGKAADETGAALPGVSVTAVSESMQGSRTTVTGDDGSYRIPAVPPGTYKLTFELGGFGTVVREGVIVGLGFTATINVDLKVASLEETVTVSGQSPVVDVTSTTSATTFAEEKLSSLPNARDFWTILAAAPAIQLTRIDVAGSAAGTQTAYAAYDTKSDQHRPMVEGIVNTEGTNAAGFYYDYGAVDEVAINAGGNTAEMPWPGVWSNFVAKSGGNTYHGKVYYDYQNEGIQAENIPDSLVALCPGGRLSGCGNLTPSDLNRISSYHDVNGDIGGFVKKDKLWWYFSARDQNIKSLVPNFPVKPFETSLRNLTGKATYALNQNNKITGYAQGGKKLQPNRLDTYRIGATIARHETADSTWRQEYWGHTYKAGWDSVINDKMFFEVRGGQFKYKWPNFRYTQEPAFQDTGNNLVRGGNRDGWIRTPARNQILGSLSYFKEGWAGSHNFKIGGEWFRETFTDTRGADGLGFVPGDVLHILNNGNPLEVWLFQTPTTSENGLRTTGLYLQDTWQVTTRVTLNLGIRYDRYRTFLPEQEGPPPGRFNSAAQLRFDAVDNLVTFNSPAPRVGVVYDLTGAGKTVLKFNYGTFWWNPGTGIAQDVNQNPAEWYRRYNWSDGNRNGLYDPGEEGTLIASQGGLGSAVLDSSLNQQRTDEVASFFEHELMPNFAIHFGYVYRRIDNLNVNINANRPFSAYNVPTTIRDPGPDGVIGNGDDGPNIPGFNLSAAALAAPVVNTRTNLAGKSEFHTIEYAATRRQTGRWSLAASGSIRLNRDNDTGYFGQTIRTVQAVSNPNELINTTDGRFSFSTWTFKLNSTVDAGWGVHVTPALRVQSGQPFGRVINAGTANGINYGTQRILAEPIDSREQDDIVILDLRAERRFKLGKVGNVAGFFDIYNIGNSDAANNISWVSGSNFLVPSAIIGPRIMRFGVKYDW
jgi:hypothetical protein